MKRDKKSRGSLLRLEGPDPALLQAAYAEVSADVRPGAVSRS